MIAPGEWPELLGRDLPALSDADLAVYARRGVSKLTEFVASYRETDVAGRAGAGDRARTEAWLDAVTEHVFGFTDEYAERFGAGVVAVWEDCARRGIVLESVRLWPDGPALAAPLDNPLAARGDVGRGRPHYRRPRGHGRSTRAA